MGRPRKPRPPKERWSHLNELGLSRYDVSDQGNLRSHYTTLKLSVARVGMVAPTVFLYDDNDKESTRSLPRLVASQFVDGFDDVNNTPIHLNGLKGDCRASNLMWRPLWYARLYHEQWEGYRPPYIPDPIMDVRTLEIYKNARAASQQLGILELDIFNSIHDHIPTRLTNQMYKYVD